MERTDRIPVRTRGRRTLREVLNDDVLGLAAQTAYYFLFSLFPILLFITPLLGMLLDVNEAISWVERQLGAAVPPEALTLVSGIIDDVVLSENAPGLASVGAVLALWAGSNVFNTLAGALNKAFDCTENRAWWKTRLIAISMVLLSAVVLAIGFITLMAGERIIGFVATLVNMGDAAALAWTIGQYALAVLLLIAFAFLTFRLLPNTTQRWQDVLVGALVTAGLWIVATMLFRLYVVNFANYNQTYGTIGAVIILLMWMYIVMVVLLVGGELCSELRKVHAARVDPAATGC